MTGQIALSAMVVALSVGWIGWRIWRRRRRPAACPGCGGGCGRAVKDHRRNG